MKLSHTRAATLAVFDDPNLVSAAGLVPLLALADSAGPSRLAGERLSVPGDKGAHARLEVPPLAQGAGAAREERGMAQVRGIPVPGQTALALVQPQVFKAGKMNSADIEQVMMVHDVDTHRMLDAAAARSLLRWNSV